MRLLGEHRSRKSFVVLAVLLASSFSNALACAPKPPSSPTVRSPGAAPSQAPAQPASQDVPEAGLLAGDLRSSHVAFQVVVFHQKPPSNEAIAALTETLAAAGITVQRTPLEDKAARPAVALSTVKMTDFPPPSAAALLYAGDGASDADKAAVQAAGAVTVFWFLSPSPNARAAASTFTRAVAAFETAAPGLIWDGETRLAYRGPTFDPLGVDRGRQHPDVRQHVSLHAYRFGEHLRMVTLGMGKLGLPDLAVEGVAVHDADGMSQVIMLVAQTMLEHPQLPPDGLLSIDRQKVASESARAALAKVAVPDTGPDRVLLEVGKLQEGDVENRLLQLTFPGPADTLQERHAALIARVIGRTGEVRGIRGDDPELLAAGARAHKKLMLLKPKVVRGLPEVEHLAVKVPVAVDGGGIEWMWMEVVRWRGTRIEGILQSDPLGPASVKRGAHLAFEESVVFDYVHTRADGTREGNETEAVLKRSGVKGR